MTPAQQTARQASGRRQKARWIRLGRERAHRKRPSDTLPREIPLYLAALDAFRLPSLVRVYGPDGRLRVVLDPFTRRPV